MTDDRRVIFPNRTGFVAMLVQTAHDQQTREIITVCRPTDLPPLPFEAWVGRWHAEHRSRVWVWQASDFSAALNDLDEPQRMAVCLALNALHLLAAPLVPAVTHHLQNGWRQ